MFLTHSSFNCSFSTFSGVTVDWTQFKQKSIHNIKYSPILHAVPLAWISTLCSAAHSEQVSSFLAAVSAPTPSSALQSEPESSFLAAASASSEELPYRIQPGNQWYWEQVVSNALFTHLLGIQLCTGLSVALLQIFQLQHSINQTPFCFVITDLWLKRIIFSWSLHLSVQCFLHEPHTSIHEATRVSLFSIYYTSSSLLVSL